MNVLKTSAVFYFVSTMAYGVSVSQYQPVSYEKDISVYLSDGMLKQAVMFTIAALRGPFIAPRDLYNFLKQ